MREFARLLRGTSHFSTAQNTKASLESITREDLIAFHKQYFHPANFIFAVSGDFNSEEMLGKLEEVIRGWGGTKPAAPPVPKPQYSFEKLGKIARLALPDPVTMEYPK